MDNFKWTDELVIEYGLQVKSKIDIKADMEAFKASKLSAPLGWEVLEFKDINNVGLFYKKDYDGWWRTSWQSGVKKEDDLLKEGFPINAVKRPLDGEVFNIGDFIKQGDNTQNKILGFELRYDGTQLWILTEIRKGYGCDIDIAKKVKEPVPLFTTANLIPIFDGGTYYKVWDNWLYTKYEANEGGKYPPEYSNTTFSTEKAAKNFIKCHKPVLTLLEVLSCIDEENYYSTKQKLTDIVKSKIQ